MDTMMLNIVTITNNNNVNPGSRYFVILSIGMLPFLFDVITALSPVYVPVSPFSTTSSATTSTTTSHSNANSVATPVNSSVRLSSSSSSVSTTRLEYKFNDDSDDGYSESWYPIPVGQIKLIPKSNLPVDDTDPIQTFVQNSPMMIGKTDNMASKRRDRSRYYHQYLHRHEDSSYYPIPVDGDVKQQEEERHTTNIMTTKNAQMSIIQQPSHQQTTTILPDRKPLWTQITGFQDLCNYLEDDERLTVIKFYAPWCKSCRKLGHNLKKVANDYGDIIVNRVKVNGLIRFGKVEYSNQLQYFISNIMQIKGIPTIQVYYKTYKIYDTTGIVTTKELVEHIQLWLSMNHNEQIQYAKDIDDGLLQNTIENHFYDDYPDFLEEEW